VALSYGDQGWAYRGAQGQQAPTPAPAAGCDLWAGALASGLVAGAGGRHRRAAHAGVRLRRRKRVSSDREVGGEAPRSGRRLDSRSPDKPARPLGPIRATSLFASAALLKIAVLPFPPHRPEEGVRIFAQLQCH